MDVKVAFLNGRVSDDIWVEQPPGFNTDNNLVCKLKGSLYGLRSSPKEWFKVLQGFLIKQGFTQAKSDECLFHKDGTNSDRLFVTAYVDDLLIVGNQSDITTFKALLAQAFEIHSLGAVRRYLSLNVSHIESHDERKYTLDQIDYIDEICTEFKDLIKSKEYRVPLTNPTTLKPEVSHTLPSLPSASTSKASASQSNERYHRLIGKLIYLTCNTRPDLQFAVSTLSRYVSAPSPAAWTSLKQLLSYLKSTRALKLTLRKPSLSTPLQLSCFTDASFASGTGR